MLSVKDTWEQIGTQIQVVMKDNMVETLAVDLKELSVTSTPTFSSSVRAHTPLHTHSLIRLGTHKSIFNAVKNVYTLLHQSRQTNELLTDEMHPQTIYIYIYCVGMHPFHLQWTWPASLSQLSREHFNEYVCCVPLCVSVSACIHVLGSLCVHKSLLEV